MQGHREEMIEKLSTYMQSTERNYKDHYATLVHWYEQDKGKLKENSKSKVYTFEDYDKGNTCRPRIRRWKGVFRALMIK